MMRGKHFLIHSVILRFITILLVLMIIPFTILLISTSLEIKQIEHERADEYLSGNLNIISTTADHVLKGLESYHTEMLLNTRFVKAVNRLAPYDQREEYSDYKSVRTIKDVLRDTAVRDNNISTIYLYCLDAQRLFISNINWNPAYNNCDLTQTQWFKDYEANQYKRPWCITTALEDGDKTILSCYRIIQNYHQPLKGLISINMSSDVLINMLGDVDMGENGVCFIMDAKGNVLYDKGQPYGDLINYAASQIPLNATSGSTDIVYNKNTLFLSYLYSEYSGFTYVACAPLSQIQSATSRVTDLTVWYVVESVLLIAVSILLVYGYFFKPIRSLAHGMQRVQTGDFEVRMPENRKDEIGLINRQFNDMTKNIKTLIDENFINELAKRDIHLKLVQNQINEHFLYNTLDSIHWLAKEHSVPKVSKIISALSNFYRISLSHGKDRVSVKDLSKLVSSYLYIQGIRLGESLTYQIEFDDALMSQQVPKYLFIPLVENAIVHGINGLNTGNIQVCLTRTGEHMRFSVSDNGNGITAKRLKKIYASLQSEEINIEDSFALRNINIQLAIYYNNHEGIHIETAEGLGTTVWFEIPVDINI